VGDGVPGQSGLPLGLKLAADAEAVQSTPCYPWSCYAIDQRNTERHQTIGPCSKREILKREIHNAEIVAGLPETEIDLDAGVVVIAL
jgi:hypothetical protein